VTERRTKTAGELRRFGFVLGAAFTVLGSVSWWRGGRAAPYFLGVAGILFVAAVAAPLRLRRVERWWMALADRLALISSTVILMLTFLTIITPIAFVRRLKGDDDLGLRFDKSRRSYWSAADTDGPGQRHDKPY